MFYLLWQTLFWIALAVATGIFIGWWIWHRRSLSYGGSAADTGASGDLQANDDEIVRLNAQVQKEQQRVKTCLAEIKNLKGKLDSGQSKAFTAGSFVSQDGKQIDEEAYANLESQLRAAKSSHQNSDSQIAKLKSQLASANSGSQDAKAATDKISQLESQLNAANSAHQNCDNTIAKLKSELASAQSSANQADGTAAQVSQLESQLSEAKANADKVGKLETQLADAKSAHKNCDSDIAKLKSELSSVKSSADQAGAAASKVNDLESQLAVAKSAHQNCDSEIAKLKSELSSVKSSADQASAAASKVKEMESQLNAAKSVQQNYDNDIADLKRQLADAQSQAEKSAATSHETEQIKSQLAAAKSDINRYQQQYNEQLSNNKKLADDLSSANQNASSQAETAAQSERLSSDLEQSRQQLADSKSELSKLQKENADLAMSLEKANQSSASSQAFTAANFSNTESSDHDSAAVDDSSKPVSLNEPEGGKADDLTIINGIGPKLNTTLNDLGIYHYHQIASFNRDNIEWVDGYLSFKGRIDREQWVPQAKALMGDQSRSSNDDGKPVAIAAPEGGKADDLTLIKGIGPKLNGLLNDLGIYHFHQIASFNQENIEWVDDFLSFKGRIDREQWVAQAKILASGGSTEFSKRQ